MASDLVLMAAGPLMDTPSFLSRLMFVRSTQCVALEKITGDLAVITLGGAPEGAVPELGYFEKMFFFPAKVDFFDGRGPQLLAVNRFSADSFLTKNRFERSHDDVASDFFGWTKIALNVEAGQVVRQAFAEHGMMLRSDDYDSLKAVALGLKQDIATVASHYCQIARGILPPFVTSKERLSFFIKEIVGRRVRAYALQNEIDFPRDLEPHLDLILESSRNYNVSLEQVASQVLKATELQPALAVKRAVTQDCLTFEELVKTLLYVEQDYKKMERELQANVEHLPLHIFSRDGGDLLPRSLIYFKGVDGARGRVLLLFNKHGRKKGDIEGKDALAGKGAYSRVKEAIDLDTGELYVVVSQMLTEQADKEFTHHYKLQGQGISKVIGYLKWQGRDINNASIDKSALIMPRYKCDLHQLLYQRSEEDPPLEWQKRRQIALDIIEGLRRVHKKGLIHRDMKPSNVLIDAQGRAFLADFGMVEKEGNVKLPGGGTGVYRSPEYSPHYRALKKELKNESERDACIKTTTQACDNWALGIILWELFGPEIDSSGEFGEWTFKKFVDEKRWEQPFAEDWIGDRARDALRSTDSEAAIAIALLHPDPAQRITASIALERVRQLEEPRGAPSPGPAAPGPSEAGPAAPCASNGLVIA